MEQEIQFGAPSESILRELDTDVAGPRALTEAPLPSALDAIDTGLVAASPLQRFVKRVIDICLSALAIVVLSPLLVGVAFLVKVTSRGSVFYVQERIGKGGRPFRMIKFRSMYRDAHDRREEHLVDNMHDGPIFKIRNDPRITAVGRVIRRTSIDELPQLFNVLKGDMSLVGPRPPLPEEFLDYTDRERCRLLVKPGVTCIWQVSGRSDVDFDTWVDMDLEYIATWSLALDLKLLVLTVPAVITGRGAY